MALRRLAKSEVRLLLRLAQNAWGQPVLSSSNELLQTTRCLPLVLRAVSAAELPRQDTNSWRGLHTSTSQPLTDRANDGSSPGADPQTQQQKEVSSNASSPSAEACDDILGTLKEAKAKVAYNPYPTSVGQKVQNLGKLVVNGIGAVLNFIFSVPGRLAAFAKLSRAERIETYKGWWQAIKKEAHHYWLGTKLLGTDVKITARLVGKTLKGKTLTRLVPMAVFVLVPFMELLLPVALKIFPSMLPSTFEDKLKKEEDMKRRLTAKLEVASFLQGTVQEMAKDMKRTSTGATQASASQLYDFMKRVRAGEMVSNYELMKFAPLFNDELTLDNLERVHLINLCRFVGISPFGTDSFLVSRLRHHLAEIKRDDRSIKEEGVESLSEEELRAACRARGMRAPFGEGAQKFMQRQLMEWLDLSLNRSLPSSLLLLSRAFTVTQPMGGSGDYDSLKDTLSSLPREVVDEIALARPADGTDLGAEYQRKLEQLKREEELIHEEELEAEAIADSSEPVAHEEQSTEQMTAAAAASAIVREAAASAVMDVLEGESQEEKAAKLAAAKQDKMKKVISALTVLASSSGVTTERQAFMGLVKNEIDRLNASNPNKSLSMVFRAGGVTVDRPDKLVEVVGQSRLADKVTGILDRLEKELDEADVSIGSSMHVLDLDGDGLVTKEELQMALSFLKDQLGQHELRLLLERMDAFNDDTKLDVKQLMQLADGNPADSVQQSADNRPLISMSQ